MKATGIVRKIDELGRIFIPRELINHFSFEERQPLEIFVSGERIVLQKYQPGCVFCGNIGGTVTYKGQRICLDCIKEASKAV